MSTNQKTADVVLTSSDLEKIENILRENAIAGDRYSEGSMKLVNR